MKKMVLWVLLAGPAMAHTIPFDEKDFLDLAGNDPAKARAVKVTCSQRGLTLTQCREAFAGSGNLAAEAALKCEVERMSHLPVYHKAEPAGARAHQVFGKIWHEDQRDGHAHAYSTEARTQAANEAFDRRLTQMNNQNQSFKGAESKTTGTEGKGGFEAGIPNAFTVNFTFGGHESKTITVTRITPEQIAELKNAWLSGWNKPDLWGTQPDIAVLPNGQTVGGEPAPTKTEKDVKATKTPEKKGADNGPENMGVKLAEDSSNLNVDIPDNESTSGGDVWTGNDLNTDADTAIVKAIDFLDVPKTGTERCLERETKRLNDEMGKKTFDPNANAANHEEKERANSLLKFGYCDEQIMGRDFCQKKAFREQSYGAVEIQEARKEASTQALDIFRRTGVCDPNALGVAFCKAARTKQITNPQMKIDVPDTGKNGISPRPLGPIKPGDLPKPHEKIDND